MMSVRVDAHQHFWHYDSAEYAWIDESMAALRRDFMPEELAHEMAGAGFHACVAVQTRQMLEETAWLLSLAGRHAFIAGVVGWVDLQADDVRAQLQQAASNPRLVGIRHLVLVCESIERPQHLGANAGSGAQPWEERIFLVSSVPRDARREIVQRPAQRLTRSICFLRCRRLPVPSSWTAHRNRAMPGRP